jgi:hypothetical protein
MGSGDGFVVLAMMNISLRKVLHGIYNFDESLLDAADGNSAKRNTMRKCRKCVTSLVR